MNIEDIRKYCLSKKGATEDMPFDDVTLVFKISSKIFALTSLSGDLSINLKFTPEKVIERKERYSYVLPGYHMNKKHWVTVELSANTNKKQIQNWIDESYDLILNKLPKKVQLGFL